MTDVATFQVPATIVTGAEASSTVGEHARRLGAERALLVTDPFMRSSGVAEIVARYLESAGVTTSVFDGVQPDPTDANVTDGLEALEASEAEVVVAIGGGSVLDAAKMIASPGPTRAHSAHSSGYHKITNAGLPLIAIPTTAGTGSEATRVAVITDTVSTTKMMILDGNLVPAVALVDYELTMTMPPALTAYVGIDTLTHGIEAYVSALANPMTDAFALSCVRLVGSTSSAAWRDPAT